ncbi:MAG: Gldg family protein [Bauldia sp.]|nr:Gldg family protein [Bauldia sp.]
MRVILTIARREFAAYFSTPLAYVFIVAFLAASAAATFYFGGFMEQREASLDAFFTYLPALLVVLIPAVGMRLWAEERGQGTIELLMTLPVTPWQGVIGKFLAAWAFVTLAIALTFPIWITVNYLGDPDNGVILAGYIGTVLMAGALLAAASAFSALTRSQVVAFVYGVVIALALMVAGLAFILNAITGWAPQSVVDLVASFSLYTHFGRMTRGVLEPRSLVFFFSLIVLFLFIARQVVEIRRDFAASGALVAIVVFFGVNLVASLGLGGARIDLTADRLYTVSPATRTVIAGLEEPITLRFYLSSALVNDSAEVRTFADRVGELLRTYERLGDGMIRLERIDPVPYSTEEDKAVGFDLVGFPLSRAGEQAYIGLVGTNSVDQVETIPAFGGGREAYLEYDITRLISRLSSPTEPRIGIIDRLGIFGNALIGRAPSAVVNMLGDDYELVQIAPTATLIPEDVDVLVLVHPYDLSDNTIYAIDQYVMRGGPVVAFLDPLAEHSAPSPGNPTVPQYPSSSLDRLMTAWGVRMAPDAVVGDTDMALALRAQAGNEIQTVDYLPWLIVDQDNINPDDIATAQLTLMRIQSAGSIVPIEGAETTLTPLVYTTTESMLIDQITLLRRTNPFDLLSAFAASGVRQTLAARIVGPAGTAFPEGPPPVPAPAANAPPPAAPLPLVTRSEQPIRIIVVADTDMLADDVNLTPDGQLAHNNIPFVINAIDSLTGGVDLINLRSRGLLYRPFTRLDAIESEAEARYRATEIALQAELDATEERLSAVRGQAMTPAGEIGVLTQAQQSEINANLDQIETLRQELRAVQGSLRRELDAVSTTLRLVNIFAVPVLVILVGLAALAWRRLRLRAYLRRRRIAAAAAEA